MEQETRTFDGVDRVKVERLRSAISGIVALPEGDTGEISKSGFAGRFHYEEPAQRLTLTITEAPFFMPKSAVWSTIERALA